MGITTWGESIGGQTTRLTADKQQTDILRECDGHRCVGALIGATPEPSKTRAWLVELVQKGWLIPTNQAVPG